MSDDRNNIEQRVIRIVADYVGADANEIGRESAFQELGINSLDALDVLFQLEEEFDVSIPNEVAGEIRTVGQAIDGLASLVRGEAPSGETPSAATGAA